MLQIHATFFRRIYHLNSFNSQMKCNMKLTDAAFWKGSNEGKNIFSSEGNHVTLLCDVSMNPWGWFEWEFNGGELPTNAAKSDNILTLLSVKNANFGRYTCIAMNELLGLNHSVPFGIELKKRGTPEEPIDITVEASTSVSVTLGWTCGHNGGDDNMWFELYISKVAGDYEVYDDHITADCSIGEKNRPDYRVNGLESETQYTFRIDSVNIFGKESQSVQYTTPCKIIAIINHEFSTIADIVMHHSRKIDVL